MQRGRHLLILRRNATLISLDPKWSEWKQFHTVERQWKCVLWLDESTFKLVFGKTMYVRILCAKVEKYHPVLSTNEKCKNQPLWWYGGASVPTAWVICIYLKVPLMWRLILEFRKDVCCHQDNYFSQELRLFQQENTMLIRHELQHNSVTS